MTKSVILLIYFMLICNILIAQTDCKQNPNQYIFAHNYIIKDSINIGKVIIVSDSIVDIDRYWVNDDLINFPKEKESLNQYRKNKNYIWDAPYYSSCLSALFCNKKNPDSVLFFSKIDDNMLFADLLPYNEKKYGMFSYEKMAFQNTGFVYLFIYDEKGKIKAIFKREIIYN